MLCCGSGLQCQGLRSLSADRTKARSTGREPGGLRECIARDLLWERDLEIVGYDDPCSHVSVFSFPF